MLTSDEKKFLDFWERNRLKEKSLASQFRFVIPIAFILGAAILLNFFTGWYTRANMVANAQFNPMVLIVGVVIIAIFSSVFYKRHRWEMNEQHYTELIIKQKKETVQHDETLNSQS